MKLALNMIVAPTDEEAVVLKRCLTSIAPFVDGIFITITGKNKKCEDVVNAFGGVISTCVWENDFGKARNFALSQIPKEYDYFLWVDADDVIRGGDKLRATIEEHKSVDVFVFNYLYAFDKWNNPVVVHLKSRVLRNDNCVEWAGKLHEDFKANRALESKFVEGIDILHLSDEARFDKAKERNKLVAQKALDGAKDDPRTYWNLGNSCKALGENRESIKAFETFMELSKSDDEKYIVCLRLAELFLDEEDYETALEYGRYAIGLKPLYPDAYITTADVYKKMEQYEEAKGYYLLGLDPNKQPPYHEIIVFNPRAYDYEPLMKLADVYFKLSMPQLALQCLKSCSQIVPLDKDLKKLIEKIDVQAKIADKAVEAVGRLKEMNDEELKIELDKLPDDIKSHPHICHLRNTRIIKETSSGKDLVFMCSYTADEWNPEIAKATGIGGSEEAVINLSKELVELGWNVTVFNNCGHKELEFDGVKYKPFWAWNARDKQDVTILWRTPKFLDYDINSDKVFVDMHDVIGAGEYNERRLAKLTGIFFKSKAHRNLFPNIPDEKCIIIPNGIHWADFQGGVKDPYLMINTSSPDRSIKTLIKAFKRVKEQVPQAKMKWAYGWNVWDNVHSNDQEKIDWKKEVEKEIEGTTDFEALGRIGHTAVAQLYKEATVFAYPTAFFEIDCISARKAQSAGAFPVSTDFGALDETIQFGHKVKTNLKEENWDKAGAFDFSLKEERAINEWVEKCVECLTTPPDSTEMVEWTKQFDWTEIAKKWNENL